MSVSPLFLHDGWFPFCVADMTSAEIATATEYDELRRCHVASGLTLYEAWRLYWMIESTDFTVTFRHVSEPSDWVFDFAGTTVHPSKRPPYRGCYNGYALLLFSDLRTVDYVQASPGPGFPPTDETAECSFELQLVSIDKDYAAWYNGTPQSDARSCGPVVYNTDTQSYSAFIDGHLYFAASGYPGFFNANTQGLTGGATFTATIGGLTDIRFFGEDSGFAFGTPVVAESAVGYFSAG